MGKKKIPIVTSTNDGRQINLDALCFNESDTNSSYERDLMKKKIISVLDDLEKQEKTDRRKRIIEAKYFRSTPAILSELAKELNISRERVRQIEVDTIKIIKNKVGIKI
jgi:DNA-directed RNA polymerase sigma subunit (sigma70/sigma32)